MREGPTPEWLEQAAPGYHRYLLEEVVGELELHCCENSDGTRDYWLEPFVGIGFFRFRGTTELEFASGLTSHVTAYRARLDDPPKSGRRFS